MKFGISEKIVFLFVLLVITLETITVLYFIRHERDIVLDEFDERAAALIRSLAVSVEYPVLTQDTETLSVVGKGVLKQKDVIFCRIENKQGGVLFEGGSTGQEYTRERTEPILTGKTTVTPGKKRPLVLGPARKEFDQIGTVRLHFSLADLTRQLNQAMLTVVAFVLAGTALASLLIAALVRFVLHEPVRKLLAGINRISGGDLQYEVVVKNTDEIGQLADSFNAMTKALRRLLQKERKLAAQAAAAQIEHGRAAELEKAYKELERANQELNDFAHIVSHDLKAPLRGIKTLANWMTTDYADKVDAEGKAQMDLLLNRVDRMHNLIDGILQYSRVGRVEEAKVPVDLNKLIPEVIGMVAPPANVKITIEEPLPTIECEKTRVSQVFQNLLSNAVKYGDNPEAWIRIGCAEQNGCWRFSVADNGPGIEEKYLDRIFGMFQTLSARDEFESTGVGLTVAKKIVELYGGRIWAESEPGQGSTFFFTLPK